MKNRPISLSAPLQVRVEPDLLGALDRAARKNRTSRSELIRRGLRCLVAAAGIPLDDIADEPRGKR